MKMAASSIFSSVPQQGAKEKWKVSAVFKTPRIVQQLQISGHMLPDALAVMLLMQPLEMHRQQVHAMDQFSLALLAKVNLRFKSPIVPTQVRKPGESLNNILFCIIW
jgi:hypothetical protein